MVVREGLSIAHLLLLNDTIIRVVVLTMVEMNARIAQQRVGSSPIRSLLVPFVLDYFDFPNLYHHDEFLQY